LQPFFLDILLTDMLLRFSFCTSQEKLDIAQAVRKNYEFKLFSTWWR